jgi:acetyl-CoA C-acetyltransferase
MGRPVIVSACRTAMGSFQGGLAPLGATKLGALAVAEALTRSGLAKDQVDEVIMGNVLQANLGQNPARQALIGAGIPPEKAAMTINKVCGSGLKSVMLAAQAIKAGDITAAVAGGMESMSNAPYYLPQARSGQRLGNGQLVDGMIQDGLWDVYNDFHMGMTGELVASEYGITREEQDAFAVESHRKAAEAWDAGRFDAEVFKVEVPGRKGAVHVVDRDEGVRSDATMESMARLRPAFKRDGGSVTAANASSINDGASALVVMDEDKAKDLGLAPMARILGYATGGMAPEWVMMAPEVAFKNVCSLLNCSLADWDLIELNEAFSVAAVALTRKMELDPAKVNVNGGAVAIGHPIGASGARILTTLLYALKDRGLSRGLAGLCLGGGNAVVTAVEMC